MTLMKLPRKPAKPKPRRKVKPAKVGYEVADDGCWVLAKKPKRKR